MACCCFSYTAYRNRKYKRSFSYAGLESKQADLGDGTVISCWVPETSKPEKPNLILIPGLGSNTMWQYDKFITPLMSNFNVYAPDLLFFGESYTTRPERTVEFQARCVMGAVRSFGVSKMMAVGLSYGGFVAYSLAALFPEAVEKLIVGYAAVCMEDGDNGEGMFTTKNAERFSRLMVNQTPKEMQELMSITMSRPVRNLPSCSCVLQDYIDVMCRENLQERKELVEALYKGRKLSEVPKIHQPTLLIWGELDRIFPVEEEAYKLKRYLDDRPELVIVKDAGHAINFEKPRELLKHIEAFLVDAPSPGS